MKKEGLTSETYESSVYLEDDFVHFNQSPSVEPHRTPALGADAYGF